MKALIPVAGIGSKLRPHTHTQPKGMVPVAGKPIIAHIVDGLLDAGIHKLVFVIGYLGDKIETYIRQHYLHQPGVEVEFVVQDRREGLAQAVWIAKAALEKEDRVLIVLGDTIVKLDMAAFLNHKDSVVGVKKVEQPGLFGVAEVSDHGLVKKLIEKPQIPKSNLALVGIYNIAEPAELIKACKLVIERDQRSHGEYQLTDALMYMVQRGNVFRTQVVDNWFDCGRKDNLLEANALLMSRPDFESNCATECEQTILVPPVSIAKGCRISHSIIGPNVTIGENATIRYSIVKDTIVGAYSELGFSVLDKSIIANDSILMGPSQSLNIGDNTEINFGN